MEVTSLLFIGVIVILIAWFLAGKDPPPIRGVYSFPDKWYHLKYIAFYVLFSLRKYQNKRQKEVSGSNAGYGMRSRSSVEDMEKAQPLDPNHEKAVDAVYFNGANKEGYYLVGATARRHNKLVQTFLFIRIPGVGLLELPSQPDTSLYATEDMAYAAGGLKFEPVQPMKTWKLTFSGKMRLLKPDKSTSEAQVSFSLDWTAYTAYFDFDTDLDVWAMCGAMAREKWTRPFFDDLRKAHQTHYEQFGNIEGAVEVEDHGKHQLYLQGVRDHSYGNLRDWKDLHRYGIQYFHLEDGSAVCIGNICMPRTMSRLIIGYIFHPNGSMDTVSSTDWDLHEYGEDGEDPTDLEFNFVAGGKNYKISIHVLDRPRFYMGVDWDARIHERMCTFKMNGVAGWGISEWDYRNKEGKPKE